MSNINKSLLKDYLIVGMNLFFLSAMQLPYGQLWVSVEWTALTHLVLIALFYCSNLNPKDITSFVARLGPFNSAECSVEFELETYQFL